jgi:flagellar biosynthesis protein
LKYIGLNVNTYSNKPSQQATALKYTNSQGNKNASGAPKVIAKGSGTLADEIVALAEQHGIFIHQDEHLSQILSQLDLGQEIPENMYTVIAELIAFSYLLQNKFPNSWDNVHERIDFKE